MTQTSDFQPLPKFLERVSRKLALVLRHDPGAIGLHLDGAGWADVQALLDCLRNHGMGISRADLDRIVQTNNKQRYRFDDSGTRIRANQGHSIPVNLDLEPVTPPEFLYHGTPAKFVAPIRQEGLKKMSRHHVHLSLDRETAIQVGSRRGSPVILTVRSGDMHRAGHTFYCSDNGVWLTDHVPPQFLEEND